MNILFLQFLLGVMYLTVVFLHVTRKNFFAAAAYSLQSLAMMLILFNSFLETKKISFLVIVLLTLIIKVIIAPLFFTSLIKKHALAFSVSTYLNTPFTLIVIAALSFVAYSNKFVPLTGIVAVNKALLLLALSIIFLSLFLIVNRKGALSQIIGILSLENSILAFIVFAGLEQSAGLQAGVIFNIFIWIIISTVFVSMMYKHFGTLNVTSMKNLQD